MLADAQGVWMVRAGRKSVHASTFLEQGLVAIGFLPKQGANVLTATREELIRMIGEQRPEWSPNTATNQAGQMVRFLQDIQIGDDVMTYDGERRCYYVGKVTAAPRFDPSHLPGSPYVRSVKWDRRVLRDGLSVATRNSLGAIQTLFRLQGDAASEFLGRCTPLDAPAETVHQAVAGQPAAPTIADDGAEATSIDSLRLEIREKAAGFIEDMIVRLDWDELQELVAGLLRAMGYKTRVSPPGSDRGVDVSASPDGLGLEEPRIFVEVKHRPNSTMGAGELRAFLGGRKAGDRCLYVSTGGFTREARYEAERSEVPLTLIALGDLQELVVEHYEAMDQEARALLPLTRVYWPVADS